MTSEGRQSSYQTVKNTLYHPWIYRSSGVTPFDCLGENFTILKCLTLLELLLIRTVDSFWRMRASSNELWEVVLEIDGPIMLSFHSFLSHYPPYNTYLGEFCALFVKEMQIQRVRKAKDRMLGNGRARTMRRQHDTERTDFTTTQTFELQERLAIMTAWESIQETFLEPFILKHPYLTTYSSCFPTPSFDILNLLGKLAQWRQNARRDIGTDFIEIAFQPPFLKSCSQLFADHCCALLHIRQLDDDGNVVGEVFETLNIAIHDVGPRNFRNFSLVAGSNGVSFKTPLWIDSDNSKITVSISFIVCRPKQVMLPVQSFATMNFLHNIPIETPLNSTDDYNTLFVEDVCLNLMAPEFRNLQSMGLNTQVRMPAPLLVIMPTINDVRVNRVDGWVRGVLPTWGRRLCWEGFGNLDFRLHFCSSLDRRNCRHLVRRGGGVPYCSSCLFAYLLNNVYWF